MYFLSILQKFILYIGFTYMYISRIIFCMVSHDYKTKLCMKVLIMYLHLLVFKLLPSSSPKLYLLHFKKLFWCLFNVNFYHNNFAKLHHSHMSLDRSEILIKHEKLCLLPSLKISTHLISWNERSCYFFEITSNWDLNTKWLITHFQKL
jgi:hypothetical protein